MATQTDEWSGFSWLAGRHGKESGFQRQVGWKSVDREAREEILTRADSVIYSAYAYQWEC